MLPLVAIATAVIPDLIKIIAGDRAGKVADSVAQAVTTATGTADAEAAQRMIDANPTLAAELRVKLAEIALQERGCKMRRKQPSGRHGLRPKRSSGRTP